MNKKILVSLLHKNIEELSIIAEGLMETDSCSKAIISLASRKTEDIQTILDQLVVVGADVHPVQVSDVASLKELPVEKVVVEPKASEVEVPQVEEIPAVLIEEIPEENEEEKEEEELDAKEKLEVRIVEEKTEEIITENGDAELITTVETITEEIQHRGEQEVKIITDETKVTTIAEKIISPTKSRNDVMARQDNTLSSSIANKKISDIKQAISLGDRFRFQRELFKGNGEDMNKTLNYINQLATLEEVISFLQSKYNWPENNESVEDFHQIIRRKFL